MDAQTGFAGRGATWNRRVACGRPGRRLAITVATAALAAGEISPAHVRAITAGVADAPAGAVSLIEPEALAVAREADPRAVAAVMKQFTHALDPDRADEAALLAANWKRTVEPDELVAVAEVLSETLTRERAQLIGIRHAPSAIATTHARWLRHKLAEHEARVGFSMKIDYRLEPTSDTRNRRTR